MFKNITQKCIISWFRREAGLLFLTARLCAALLTGMAAGWMSGVLNVSAAGEETDIVVVIDPGHGGENLGGEYEDYTEKDMTLIVARAMKEELEKYEGITVYLTRSGDEDISLEERAEYAKGVGADFLFCLHFNLSEYHTLYGAETWISGFGENYSKGYSFASIEMELLSGMGLYPRGVKTRLNENGEDYYGIIRHAVQRDIPCVLIEHCHLDNENDMPFYDHKEKLEEFGRLDAEAVAKYYGLKSDILGRDYGDYEKLTVDTPTMAVAGDKTEPDICYIELVEQDDKNGNVTLSLSAADYDSGMLYYSYSYDGGVTFSELMKWPDKTKDTFEFTFNVPSGTIPQVVVNAYNGYDLYTASNTLNLSSMSYEDTETETAGETLTEDGSKDENEEEIEKENEAGETPEALEVSSEQAISRENDSAALEALKGGGKTKAATIVYFIKAVLIGVIIVLAMVWSALMVIKRRRRRRRK